MSRLQIDGSWGRLYHSTSGLSISTFALNGSLSGGYSVNWLAFGFIPLRGGTVSKIRVYVNAVTGTLGSSDLVCDVYSDSAGNPNASLQGSSTVTSVPTGAGWVEFTGFSTALTVGTNYWIVLRNANGTPTSNSATYAYLNSGALLGHATDPSIGQTLVFSSTNSGSTWTRALATGSFIIDYGSGSTEGLPIQSATTSDPQIYSSREGGIKFTTPVNVGLNVIGVCAIASKVGTPTGDLRYRIYTGSGSSPVLLATTVTRAPGTINTSRSQKPIYFSSLVYVPPNTVIRVVASETTQSDTSSNRYSLEYLSLSSTDTGILEPYSVQPEYTLSTDGGSTFTDTANRWPGIWLILDLDNPFTPSETGGSRLNAIFN